MPHVATVAKFRRPSIGRIGSSQAGGSNVLKAEARSQKVRSRSTPALGRVAGHQGRVDGADRDADEPVGRHADLGEALVDPALIGPQCPAALQQQDFVIVLTSFHGVTSGRMCPSNGAPRRCCRAAAAKRLFLGSPAAVQVSGRRREEFLRLEYLFSKTDTKWRKSSGQAHRILFP